MLRLCRRNYSVTADFEPHSVIKVLSSAGKNAEHQVPPPRKKITKKVEKTTPDANKPNVNAMGIQMISRNLFEQIFKNAKQSDVDKKSIEK